MGPPPPTNTTLSADLSDGIAHMTAMSKSEMHKELITKAQSKKIPVTTVEPEPDKKVLERKKLVQEIIKREEPCSSIRKLNEQRRMEFFSKEGPDKIVTESEAKEETPTEIINMEEKVQTKKPVEKLNTEKIKIIQEDKNIKQEPKISEVNSKKSC